MPYVSCVLIIQLPRIIQHSMKLSRVNIFMTLLLKNNFFQDTEQLNDVFTEDPIAKKER